MLTGRREGRGAGAMPPEQGGPTGAGGTNGSVSPGVGSSGPARGPPPGDARKEDGRGSWVAGVEWRERRPTTMSDARANDELGGGRRLLNHLL